MYTHRRTLPLILALGSAVCAAADLPTEWIDADTGHRVIRLSREDGTQSLYFNQNAYTADGKKLIVTTAGGGIATITLATREVKPLVAGPASVLVAGHKTGDVYYIKRAPGGTDGAAGGRNTNGATVYATNVDSGATREVVRLPPGRNVSSLNADETLLLGFSSSSWQTATLPHLPEAISEYASAASSSAKRWVMMSAGCRFQRTRRSTNSSMSHVDVTQDP